MSKLTIEEANQIAAMLNQICTLTMDTLQQGDQAQRLEVARSLREFREQFEEPSEIGAFVALLVKWLEGARPGEKAGRALSAPFQRALATMLRQVPEQAVPAPESTNEAERPAEEQEPISRRVLAQLVSAVVAAKLAGDEAVQRRLAAQLITIQGKLDAEWGEKIGPLLENLRSVLGGVDPRVLRPVPMPYAPLWQSAQELFLQGDLSEEQAHDALLDRLVHNTLFTESSKNEALTTSFLRSLLDVQRQALDSERPMIATLVGAIRARLQGGDPAPFVELLEGEERAAWEKIEAGEEG